MIKVNAAGDGQIGGDAGQKRRRFVTIMNMDCPQNAIGATVGRLGHQPR
jgi:hypothetical protein